MPHADQPLAIEMRGICKRFGPTVANDGVDFDARWGEVHALIGENGAGKSTLMSVLAGLYRPDAGTVLIDGAPVRLSSPREAIGHGVGMVYQHFMLVEPFTVAENILLGLRDGGVFVETAAVERRVRELASQYGLGVDPSARVWQLSVGEQQRVEIVRLLYLGARILVFDEPTAVLTPQESTALIRTLRGLAADGYCVLFISHKLDEVLAVADRITVMRRGRISGTTIPADTDRRTLARLMVGRELAPFVEQPDEQPDEQPREQPREQPQEKVPQGDVVLDLRNLCAVGDNGLPALSRVTLRICAGETLGVAGVAGNGQRELAETITGLRSVTAGSVNIAGRDLTNRSAGEIAAAGVAHVPEDRLATGLVGGMDVSANAILRDYDRAPIALGPFLVPRAIAAFTDRLVRDHEVKTPGTWAKVRSLSGGNQQKLLLARELAGTPRAIVAVHPTRGVDVGAVEAIHGALRAQRTRGAATLLISEDLDELLALSDRIAVLYEGHVMGILAAANADPEHIGLLMAGIAADADSMAAPETVTSAKVSRSGPSRSDPETGAYDG